MGKKFTAQQIAAIQAGLPMEQVAPSPAAETKPEQEVVAETKPEDEAAPVASDDASAAPANPAPTAGMDAVVALLREQLTTVQAEATRLTVENASLQSRLTSASTHTGAMATIVGASLRNMRVALGMSAIDCAALPVDTLLQEHASVHAQFVKSFPVGGVAATAEDKAAETPAAPSAWQKAAVAATTLRPTKR